MSDSPRKSAARFPQTRWSLVTDATGEDKTVRRAMEELCQLYWKPLYSFVRREGWSKEDAEDLTQEFLARVVERRQLDKAQPENGKLRSFLLVFLKNFLSDKRKAAKAQKRGGGKTLISLDADGAEAIYGEIGNDSTTPEAVFEHSWVLTVLESVLLQLQKHYESDGRGELFAALKPMLQAGVAQRPFAGIAASLGMKEGAVKVAAFRLRKRYREELHKQIAETLTDGGSVEDELRYFFRVLEGNPVT